MNDSQKKQKRFWRRWRLRGAVKNQPFNPEVHELGSRVFVRKLRDTVGFIISPRYLSVRRLGVSGQVLSYVPGHGGDVWFVKHEGTNDVGAYATWELAVL